MTTTPTLDQLKRGIAIAEQIEALKSELDGILGKSSAPTPKASPVAKSAAAQGDGRRAKRSPETIAKMKAAQQARWAKVKGPASAKAEAPKSPVKKGGMSAAGKARIAAAQKARWAKIKGAKAPVAFKTPAKAKAEAPAKKRTISPEHRAKLAAAAKARWAAVKK
jgi:hypothetical protein